MMGNSPAAERIATHHQGKQFKTDTDPLWDDQPYHFKDDLSIHSDSLYEGYDDQEVERSKEQDGREEEEEMYDEGEGEDKDGDYEDDPIPVATSQIGSEPQVVIETSNKRGRGRPRKYPQGIIPPYKVYIPRVNPDGTPRKAGRPPKKPKIQPNPSTDPLDLSTPRKRGRPPKLITQTRDPTSSLVPGETPRGRGRPPKPKPIERDLEDDDDDETLTHHPVAPKRGRGRPPKSATTQTPIATNSTNTDTDTTQVRSTYSLRRSNSSKSFNERDLAKAYQQNLSPPEPKTRSKRDSTSSVNTSSKDQYMYPPQLDHEQSISDSEENQSSLLDGIRKRILSRVAGTDVARLEEKLEKQKNATASVSDRPSASDQALRKDSLDGGQSRIDPLSNSAAAAALPAKRSTTDRLNDHHALSPIIAIPSSEKRQERQPFEPFSESTSNRSTPTATPTRSSIDVIDSPSTLGRARPSAVKNRPKESVPASPLNINGITGGSAASTLQPPPQSASNLVKPTTSDAYFLYTSSKRARGGGGMPISTSTNLISSKLQPLNPSCLEPAVAETTQPYSVSDNAVQLYKRGMLLIYEAQLMAGYSIMFHGVGDKTPVLLELLRKKSNDGEGVGVVVQGSMRGLRIQDVLSEIETAANISQLSTTSATTATVVASSALISRAQRIASFFNGPVAAKPGTTIPPRLFLLLLSFDATALQSLRFRPVLEILASTQRIHVMATVEHVHSGMVFGTSSNTDNNLDINSQEETTRSRWLWQSLTTFIPPLDEMLLSSSSTNHRGSNNHLLIGLPSCLHLQGDPFSSSSISHHHPTTLTSSTNTTTLLDFPKLSESAALHILKSVTLKARSLFLLLSKSSSTCSYSNLISLAKKNFLASSEIDLRQLLTEFTDHGLIRRNSSDSVLICLDSDVLSSVIDKVKKM